jgi:hypothetical protein
LEYYVVAKLGIHKKMTRHILPLVSTSLTTAFVITLALMSPQLGIGVGASGSLDDEMGVDFNAQALVEDYGEHFSISLLLDRHDLILVHSRFFLW